MFCTQCSSENGADARFCQKCGYPFSAGAPQSKDEFHFQTAGTLVAIGVMVAALIKTHPEPEALQQALQEILQGPEAKDGELPAPIQAVVDRRLQELLAPLHARLRKDR